MPAAGYRHVALGSVDSTNSECLRRARVGEAGGLFVTAERQTGGRGRRGRVWVSEPGNLYCSLLLFETGMQARLGSLPLAVSVALAEAAASVLPDPERVRIKWPNDVLVSGAKVSGILLESELMPDGRQAIVIGTGINIAHAPDAGLYPTTTLCREGADVDAPTFFRVYAEALARTLAIWDGGNGIALIRERWIFMAAGIGKAATVRLPDRDIPGLFSGIDPDGRLILEGTDGTRHLIPAGDVFFAGLAGGSKDDE